VYQPLYRRRVMTSAVVAALTIATPLFAQEPQLSPEDQAKFDKYKAFRQKIPEILPTVNVIDPGVLPLTIPFREVQEHVVVDVDFGDGVALPFMFDTGAPTFVTPELAAAHGGEVMVETPGFAAGNVLLWSPLMLMSDFTLGGKLPVAKPTGEIGWSSKSPFYCITTNGLIGAPLMRNAVWQIDYGAKEITVAADVSQLDHIDGAIAVPFKVKENTLTPNPYIDLGVGNGTLTFVVDTGGGIPLTINTADFEAVGAELPKDAPTSGALAGGAAGSFEMQISATTIPIRFGDRELRVPVTVGDGMAPGVNGNVGHTFLKNFVVTFDWSTQTIHLDPLFEGDTVPALSDPPAAGIGLQGDKLLVNAIAKGGPADRAGLTLGETVTMVDGNDVRGITQDEYCALSESKPSTITTESGETYDASPIEGFFGGGQ
jgi:PDZ domain